MVLAHPMNAMLAALLPHQHRKNLHLPEISDTDRDLDSSTIAYSSVSLSFCKLGPPLSPLPPHYPPFGFLDAISAYVFERLYSTCYVLVKYFVQRPVTSYTCMHVSAVPPTSRVINLQM